MFLGSWTEECEVRIEEEALIEPVAIVISLRTSTPSSQHEPVLGA